MSDAIDADVSRRDFVRSSLSVAALAADTVIAQPAIVSRTACAAVVNPDFITPLYKLGP